MRAGPKAFLSRHIAARVVNDTLAPHRAPESEATPLVRGLCQELEAAGVSYCHWKGNAFIDRALRAEDDLDLLVRRADVDRFTAILHGLGFKEARAASGAVPGVSHYYGYDGEADALVHVHAYNRLIVGDDLTENYRIPVENALLAAAARRELLPMPPAELELIVFVIRKTLEHSTWEAVLLGHGRLSAKARRELDFLLAHVDRALVERQLEQHLPFIDRELFADCLHALESQAGTRRRLRAGRRLAARLAPYARHSRATDLTLKLWRLGLGRTRRLRSKPSPRKRLDRGGAIVAVVGADGAGKSTVVEALCDWLGDDFAVRKVHLGKPSWSSATFVLRALLKARKELLRLLRRDPGSRTAAMLPAVATARDRYSTYARSARFALDGGLVICDRFPLPQLTLMDAPQIERAIGAATPGRLVAAMSRLEQRYYRRLAPPDVLIVLRVDPEIAVQRQPSDGPDYVRTRWSEIWKVDWQSLGAHVIDAGRSQTEVVSDVKALVWAEL
jgi:thymidylate kinase